MALSLSASLQALGGLIVHLGMRDGTRSGCHGHCHRHDRSISGYVKNKPHDNPSSYFFVWTTLATAREAAEPASPPLEQMTSASPIYAPGFRRHPQTSPRLCVPSPLPFHPHPSRWWIDFGAPAGHGEEDDDAPRARQGESLVFHLCELARVLIFIELGKAQGDEITVFPDGC